MSADRIEKPNRVDVPLVVLFLGVAFILLFAKSRFFSIVGLGTVLGVIAYVISVLIRRKAGQVPLRSATLGWILKCAGIVILVGIFVADHGSLEQIKPPLSFLFFYLLFWLGLVPVYLGYKLCQRTITPFEHTDKRPPVVYLRSFTDDEHSSFQPQGWYSGLSGIKPPLALFEGTGWDRRIPKSWFFLPINPIRIIKLLMNADRYYADDLFASVFRQFGPFVAIGRPGEVLPTPGSDKMYVVDSQWQDVVKKYLADCRVVVLQPSDSAGVRWEVEQVLHGVPREKIILSMSSFHRQPQRYEEFRNWVGQQLNVWLPAEIPSLPQPCLVYFESDGTLKVQPVLYRPWFVWPFVVSAVDAERTFGAFVRRLESPSLARSI